MRIITKVSKIITATIMLLSYYTMYAQTFEVVSNSRSNLELSLTIDKFTLEDSNHDGIEGKSIIQNGCYAFGEIAYQLLNKTIVTLEIDRM